MARRLSVHFAHGLESGPQAYKVQTLREWADVTCLDMEMSLWNPLQANSLVRSLAAAMFTAWPSEWRAAAATRSLEGCIAVHESALSGAGASSSDVLLGSSWGGAVALRLLADGIYTGPAVLLCPAHRLIDSHAPALREATTAAISRLAALPATRRARMLIIHGTADTTVPLADSRELSAATGIRLVEVEGGSHSLSAICRDGRLRQYLEAVVQGHHLGS
jgi:pimeloyl-ACP methyl ester carboxylesterase